MKEEKDEGKKYTKEEIKAAAEEMLSAKEFRIGNVIFVNKVSLEQYELIDDLLADYPQELFMIDPNASEFKLGTQILDVKAKLRKDKKLRKLYSYYLINKSQEEFSIQEAEKNEELFKKINDKEDMEIFRSFFIGKYASFSNMSAE